MLASRALRAALNCSCSVRVVSQAALRKGGKSAGRTLQGATAVIDCVNVDLILDTTVAGIVSGHVFALEQTGTGLGRAFGGVGLATAQGSEPSKGVLSPDFLTKQYASALSAAEPRHIMYPNWLRR